MTGKSYGLPDDITTLGDVFRKHVLCGDVAYLGRLVGLDRKQALDFAYDAFEIDPAPGEWPFGLGACGAAR